MSFDKETRNLLAKTVAACRRRLTEDVTDQLRGTFGLHPDGTILPLEKLTHLTEEQAAVARRLRELLDHYASGAAGTPSARRKAAYERLVLEISFTALNRLAALRLCEERGLVVECVRKGTASDGFRLFERVSGGALGTRYETYRVFLECLFDELALDLGVLFDRFTPQSAVFPGERCLEEVLDELNKPDLAHLWTEDETIGWIYQYFNPPEERKAMREASQAPRNSRELAVRNQFFTPRYVVEFLTDNTLGRNWYKMRKGDTRLKEECRFLVRRPNEVFLETGEKEPSQDDAGGDLSQEELLKQPVYVEHRPKKDPRDIKILDPACGSGHFLLYAFDLLETIYEEAWEDPESPASEVTGRTLREEFETLDELRRNVPKLIIEHNLHGIDIDPRAVQIAALALWLRAQKTWKRLGLKPAERPRVTKSNIVTAEPMPGEEDMRREFIEALRPKVLGQLTDVVFEKMKLASEAGSLLKIEEEIRDAVAEAKKQWVEGPKPEQAVLFPELVEPKPEQRTLFDVKEITDEEFWNQAEERILTALKEYAERAENGRVLRRRLFAEDAARGFAFVDLCRKRFDVVLMNPPFGEFSTPAKSYSRSAFPNTYNDIFAAFTERFFWLLNNKGTLGAITSRTGFFLTTFTNWRKEFLLKEAALRCLADLGLRVMDDAMVEAAAYCLERGKPHKSYPCIRMLCESDKETALANAIESIDENQHEPNVFWPNQIQFRLLPGAPFVYWVDEQILRKLSQHQSISPSIIEVKQGLATADDPRFARAFWEVPQANIRCRRKNNGTWVPYIKGGSSQPWFAPVTLLVNWGGDAAELRNSLNAQGKIRSNIWMLNDAIKNYFFRPGFSWTRRAVRFIPYIVSAGCIPSASRYMAYPAVGREYAVMGVVGSNVATAYLRFFGEWFLRPNYMVEVVKTLPWAELNRKEIHRIEQYVKDQVIKRRKAFQRREPFQEFTLPAILVKEDGGSALEFDYASLLGAELEMAIAETYGLDASDMAILEKDLKEALLAQFGNDQHAENDETGTEEAEGETGETSAGPDESLLSYVVGVLFGRWDVRIALDPSLAPKLPDPFDPLPVCPPGMLVGPDGLPAKPGGIVSEEWLRARPDANTLPPDGAVSKPTIPDSEYPLRINWDGILVDDPGFNGARPHRDDIVRRVREVLDLLWGDRAQEIEQEACEILGVRDLRDYFRKPSGFFRDHLKRYSKSRRKAPIYWPLSTASGSYTIWLYYHRLTDQTLYAAVNKYLEPKIADTERALDRLEEELAAASGREATRLRDRLNEGRTFLGELQDLREELLRVAGLPYKPDLNDGVIINAAPLHKLFRLRSWAKETEKVWKKLEKGDYDWARMAYTIWPDRVREVCRRDRSIAIAHGLEDICEVEPPAPKKKGGRGRRRKEAAR